MSSTQQPSAIIIGAGIAGLSAAIALSQHVRDIRITVYEIRSSPSTIGGAIGLNPKAMRYLDHLGVLPHLHGHGCEVPAIKIRSHRTGKQLGVIDFDDVQRFRFRGLRLMRSALLNALLKRAGELRGIQVRYGMKIERVEEDSKSIVAGFEDGTEVKADMLLGCDGVHSVVRTMFVDPKRIPIYTGIAAVYGFVDMNSLQRRVPVETTTLFAGRYGSLLISPIDSKTDTLYAAAVMRSVDVGSREGWLVKGEDQMALRDELRKRFRNERLPWMDGLLEQLDPVTLYPVYRLPEGGVWHSSRVLLLGDAAHAMPPQGESVALALEDAILLARILAIQSSSCGSAPSPQELFAHYTVLRSEAIAAAVAGANRGFETIQDRGWLGGIVFEWLTWAFLWWKTASKADDLAKDILDLRLQLH